MIGDYWQYYWMVIDDDRDDTCDVDDDDEPKDVVVYIYEHNRFIWCLVYFMLQ